MVCIDFNICPPIIAHRGASADAPENTLAAFRKVKEYGINWVEFDVMLTGCGEVVVMHDETLSRTTNYSGNVIDFPYSALQTFDAGVWFGPAFAGERIPTFAEAIQFCQDNQLSANIEIKSLLGLEDKVVTKVLAILQRYPNVPLLISSFSQDVLHCVRKYNTTIPLGFLMHDWIDNWKLSCEQLRCASVNVNHEILDVKKIEEIKSSSYYLAAYTVNDIDRAKQLYTWGVDALFSDCPRSILQALMSN